MAGGDPAEVFQDFEGGMMFESRRLARFMLCSMTAHGAGRWCNVVEPGDVLRNRYQIMKPIGRGGMADVYLAFDSRRHTEVAIKVLREDLAEDPEFMVRFTREAEALARLDHPNIVRFYSFERQGETAFIVMDYVEGTPLRRELVRRQEPLPLDETTRILQQVTAALHYAHAEGIVHRDLKPGNIMLRPDGMVLLTDFGIAKAMESATVTTIAVGTPAYMSPEQILGKAIDHCSDIYTLGVVMFQMVTGQQPFTGHEDVLTGTSTLARLRDAHLHLDAPNPCTLNPNLPREASTVITRALAKQPKDRWPDVLSLEKAWEESIGVSPGRSTFAGNRTANGSTGVVSQQAVVVPVAASEVRAPIATAPSKSLVEASHPLGSGRGRRTGLAVVVFLALVGVAIGLSTILLQFGSMKRIEAGMAADLRDPDGTQVAFPANFVGEGFWAGLRSVPRQIFLDRGAGEDLAAAASVLPPYLIPHSPFYQLQIKGNAPLTSVLTVAIPNDSLPYEMLDIYEWTNNSWRFIANHELTEDDAILSELNYVPASFMVMQTSALPPTAPRPYQLGRTCRMQGVTR